MHAPNPPPARAAPRKIHHFGVHGNGVHDTRVPGIYDPRYAELRKRLRDARIAAGLTQVQAGQLLGRNQQHINRCEAGDRRIDALELLDFANIYGCSLADLLPADTNDKDSL